MKETMMYQIRRTKMAWDKAEDMEIGKIITEGNLDVEEDTDQEDGCISPVDEEKDEKWDWLMIDKHPREWFA